MTLLKLRNLFFVWLMMLMVVTESSADSFRITNRLTASNSQDGDFFGGSIALMGRTLAVRSRNAYYDERDSQIHVFEQRAPWDWSEIATSTLSHPKQFSIGRDLAIQKTPYAPRFDTVLIGLNQNSVNGVPNGVVTTYTAADNRAGPTWTRQGDLVPDDLSRSSAYGRAISVDGLRHIVGASSHRTELEPEDSHEGYGAAFLYEREENGAWTELAKLITPDLDFPSDPTEPAAGPRFGTSVDVSGNTAIVGAVFDDATGMDVATGSAFLFREDENGEWNQIQKLTEPDEWQFGGVVTIHGDVAAVASGTERVYLYEENETGVWEALPPIESQEGAQLWDGRSVVLNDDALAIGYHNGDAGWVDVYRRDEMGAWLFGQQLTSPNAEGSNYFGFTLAMDGDRLAVSDPGSDTTFRPNLPEPSEAPGEVFLYELGSDIRADMNNDGNVDRFDYNLWASNYGSTTNLVADLNGDYVVNSADYTMWRDNFETSPSNSAVTDFAVPEPMSGWMIVMGVGLLGGFKRRMPSY